MTWLWIGYILGFATMLIISATVAAVLIYEGRIGIHAVNDPIFPTLRGRR